MIWLYLFSLRFYLRWRTCGLQWNSLKAGVAWGGRRTPPLSTRPGPRWGWERGRGAAQAAAAGIPRGRARAARGRAGDACPGDPGFPGGHPFCSSGKTSRWICSFITLHFVEPLKKKNSGGAARGACRGGQHFHSWPQPGSLSDFSARRASRLSEFRSSAWAAGTFLSGEICVLGKGSFSSRCDSTVLSHTLLRSFRRYLNLVCVCVCVCVCARARVCEQIFCILPIKIGRGKYHPAFWGHTGMNCILHPK